VTIKGSSSAQVARLIEGLLSTDIVARETAAARLAIVGPRAVDRLLATLDGLRRPDQVVAVLDVLERIADPRPAAAVFNRLDDADAAVAVAAAGVVRVALRAEDPETAAEATSALRRRLRPRPSLDPRSPSLNAPARSTRAPRSAGMRPKAIAVVAVMMTVINSTRPSIDTSATRGMIAGLAAISDRTPQNARSNPAAPPRRASSALSANS
jgi:hypothetical protein